MNDDKMKNIEERMKEMSDTLNKSLDEKVKNGEITEHEARDHYFQMMMITLMVLN